MSVKQGAGGEEQVYHAGDCFGELTEHQNACCRTDATAATAVKAYLVVRRCFERLSSQVRNHVSESLHGFARVRGVEETLVQVPVLRHVQRRHLWCLARMVETLKYAQGEVVGPAEEGGCAMYIVASGMCMRQEVRYDVGSCFGHIRVRYDGIEQGNQSKGSVCTAEGEETQVYRITTEVFQQLPLSVQSALRVGMDDYTAMASRQLFLSLVACTQSLDEVERWRVAEVLAVQEFKDGEVIMDAQQEGAEEGAPSRLFLVEQGACIATEVDSERQREFHHADAFGHIWQYGKGRGRWRVAARGAVRTLSLGKDGLMSLARGTRGSLQRAMDYERDIAMKAAKLRTVPSLACVDEDTRHAVMEIAQSQEVEAGATVIARGQGGDAVFFVVSGTLRALGSAGGDASAGDGWDSVELQVYHAMDCCGNIDTRGITPTTPTTEPRIVPRTLCYLTPPSLPSLCREQSSNPRCRGCGAQSHLPRGPSHTAHNKNTRVHTQNTRVHTQNTCSTSYTMSRPQRHFLPPLRGDPP